ncbi:MAG: hypothetical protein GX814_08215, partial [Microbacteriaceae bacterium]|nr:hypothetical protein [Microbacteriaceae bacterium]
MEDEQELAKLRGRIAQLESENADLKKTTRAGDAVLRRRHRWLSALSAVLIIVTIVVAPIAVLGTWARAQLVDTDRFTATFAPLAQEESVQGFLSDQVMGAVEENVDIDGLIEGVFDGLGELDLPSEATAALPLLQGPAAEGVRSIMRTGVDRVLASPQFAQLWETVLRQSHSQAIAVLQEDPDAILELDDDGTLSIRLETVIAEVKGVLVEQGFGFASNIPEIERSIPIVQADELAGVRAGYQAAVTTGYLLPWVLLVTLIAGVALAKRRMRELAWTKAGLAISFLTLAAGVGIGRWYFMNSMSPSIMPSRTAGVMFDHVTTSISSVLTALVVLTVIIMIGAWFAGSSKAARG